MKKRILILCFIVLCVFCFPALAGCKNEGGATDGATGGATEENDGKITVADFEQWAPDFQLIRIQGDFGKVTKNEDKTFVRSGDFSAKLQPLGGASTLTIPTIIFPLSSDLFDFDYRDFSKIDSISVEIYNASENNVKMTMGLAAQIVDVLSFNGTAAQEITLTSGWNSLIYGIEHSLIEISNSVKDVQGIYFSFENAGSKELNDAPELYMDDLILSEADNVVEVKNLIELSDGEICDFEKLYQKYIISVTSEKKLCTPKISVINAIDDDLDAPSGYKVLRLTTVPGEAKDGSYPGFIIPEKILQKSVMPTIPEAERDGVFFKFEVYNSFDAGVKFYVDFYNSARVRQTVHCDTLPGKWITFSIPLSSINAIDDLGYVRICLGEYTSDYANDLNFYFDNFRVEA